MKLVIQRVKSSQVVVDGKTIGQIGFGALIFLGVAKDDGEKEADYLVNKVAQLRMFEDSQGKMNCSASEVKAEFLVVSQFTLYGDCRKGRRPSFDDAAPPELAEKLYNYFVKSLKNQVYKVETGQFRAMMDVHLVNDGPVTFILESNRVTE
ncbi:MAG: D-tyrosyl-tRNA(Tyr) deacylase [Candidatus Omnitrophica bacterium]|nr:D-tyrosyl-tRNA(Tyr) deacylase [Candidatus Omnitrophota bacterium]